MATWPYYLFAIAAGASCRSSSGSTPSWPAWVGFEENPVTPGRLLGVALVAAGVAAVRFL